MSGNRSSKPQSNDPAESGAVTGYREERTPGNGLPKHHLACPCGLPPAGGRWKPPEKVRHWRTTGERPRRPLSGYSFSSEATIP